MPSEDEKTKCEGYPDFPISCSRFGSGINWIRSRLTAL